MGARSSIEKGIIEPSYADRIFLAEPDSLDPG
jgi:hypothetical protein